MTKLNSKLAYGIIIILMIAFSSHLWSNEQARKRCMEKAKNCEEGFSKYRFKSNVFEPCICEVICEE